MATKAMMVRSKAFHSNLVPRVFHPRKERPWFRLVTCLPIQKVGGDKKIAEGRGEQVAILSFLNSL